jgi:hypothetical protein
MFWVMAFILLFVALMIPTLAIVLNSPVVKGYFHGTDPVKLGEVIDRIRAIEDELSQMAGEIETLRDETQFVQRLLDNPDRSGSTVPRRSLDVPPGRSSE